MNEINEIRSQIGDLNRKLSDAKDRLEAAGLRHLGLSVGDRIMVRHWRSGDFEAQVTGCAVTPYGDPRPEGLKVKKSGEVGAQSAGLITEWRKLPPARESANTDGGTHDTEE